MTSKQNFAQIFYEELEKCMLKLRDYCKNKYEIKNKQKILKKITQSQLLDKEEEIIVKDLKNWVTESENNRHNREKFDCLELRSKFKNSLTKGVIITNILKQTNIPKYKIYETLKKHINNNELTEEQLSIICGINFKPKAKNFSKKRVRWLTVDILLIEFNF